MKTIHEYDKYRYHPCTEESNSVKPNQKIAEECFQEDLAEGLYHPDSDIPSDVVQAMKEIREGMR